jgi:hypothetical protein
MLSPNSPASVTRRKDKQASYRAAVSRDSRVKKLIAAGWISSAEEIPPDDIPVDPDLLNLGGSYHHPTYYYSAVQFTCVDCGVPQCWEAEDQRWYYETTRAPYYSSAKRCRACRKKNRARKKAATESGGHSERKNY